MAVPEPGGSAGLGPHRGTATPPPAAICGGCDQPPGLCSDGFGSGPGWAAQTHGRRVALP